MSCSPSSCTSGCSIRVVAGLNTVSSGCSARSSGVVSLLAACHNMSCHLFSSLLFSSLLFSSLLFSCISFVVSRRVVSCHHLSSRHVLSRHVTPGHVLSSHLFLSLLSPFSRVMSCGVMSCHGLSAAARLEETTLHIYTKSVLYSNIPCHLHSAYIVCSSFRAT